MVAGVAVRRPQCHFWLRWPVWPHVPVLAPALAAGRGHRRAGRWTMSGALSHPTALPEATAGSSPWGQGRRGAAVPRTPLLRMEQTLLAMKASRSLFTNNKKQNKYKKS